ncbi:glycosyltransferase family 2 protein [Pseudoalteromonas sp. LC2018020214]|uniref:glycosyltransferase family 2 protein n=1 Tax=Pseudoalteromonas sp. LC2018020214 TaxID=2799564 RepID=UPI001908F492|nr:glycosyltransferase family 2 protein [Pseudoalteromonas sp. LC2018020214]QQM65465.1 glycosyltransferase family 2 protein [Pseudoalteromonas sp. LC2018020214]
MPIKLSLICPVYKVAEFIPDLMQSLLQGANSDQVEVIFVDDCCPENSISLCESFILEHKSVIKFNSTIIKQQVNKGQAAARNAALLIAKGEYIGFIDSDDAIASNYWGVLSSYVTDGTKDIIEFAFEEFSSALPLGVSNEVIESESTNTALFNTGFFVWTRLYKKEMLKGLKFPEGVIYEDIYYNIHAFSMAKSILKLSNTLVYYRKRAGSTTSGRTSSYSNLLLNMTNAVIATLNSFDNKEEVVAQVARYSLLVSLKGYTIKDRLDRKLFFKNCKHINGAFKDTFNKYSNSLVAKLKFTASSSICYVGRFF